LASWLVGLVGLASWLVGWFGLVWLAGLVATAFLDNKIKNVTLHMLCVH
jgi:hypothetical protein